MLCAACGHETEGSSERCGSCAQAPLLDGRYRLVELLGRGATGATYRAERVRDGAVVAVKEIPLHRAESLKALELFEREARVLRSLRHPNIPAFIDTFTVGLGKQMMLCIVQEFIRGRTLEHERTERRFDERTVLVVLREVLTTLIYLEGLNPPVIHRDIKPQNLMRRDSGAIVLIDFGSVRAAVKDSLAGGSTVAGTFGYMAPEQFAGLATPATDIHGLGATAVSLLAGVGAEQLLTSKGQLAWRHRVTMSTELADLLTAMLEPEPTRRPTARDAASRVEQLLTRSPSPTPRAPARRRGKSQRGEANPSNANAKLQRGTTAPTEGRSNVPLPSIWSEPSPFDPAPVSRPPGGEFRLADTPARTNVAEASGVGDAFAPYLFWALMITLPAIVIAVIAGGSEPTPSAPAKAVAAPVRPPLSPPKGLAFGMSYDAVRAVLPDLAPSTDLRPEALPGRDERGWLPKVPATPRYSESGRMPGLAYMATIQIGDLPAACTFRFDSERGEPESLAMFACFVQQELPGKESAIAEAIFDTWFERYGPPDHDNTRFGPGGERRYLASRFSASAGWRDASAVLWLDFEFNRVGIMGATHAFETKVSDLIDADYAAVRQAREKAEEERRRRLEEEMKAIGRDL